MLQFFVVLLLSLLGVIGDYFIKSAGHSGRHQILLAALGYGAYVLTWPAWYFAFRRFSLSSLGATYCLITIGLMVTVDVIWFDKALGTREVAGLVTAAVAIVLLSRFTSL